MVFLFPDIKLNSLLALIDILLKIFAIKITKKLNKK
jgi:hypothetical protein